MARFFINRPVFAWVIAILIMLAGGIAIFQLPVSQYPSIAPPVVSLQVDYPGASAQTLEETVTQVIEQKLNGIDGLLYMTSGSSSAGRMTMRLTFDSTVNPDIAQMQVQNKLQLAMPSLPDEVKSQGITVDKVSDTFLQMFAFVSEDGSMNAVDLADFVASTLQDPLSRIDGVGAVSLYGAQYAMRIWLDPAKLYAYTMTPQDVVDAIANQNVQLSVGQIGASPIVHGQQLNVTVNARKKLNTPEQFEQILLRVNRDGASVFLRDVARVEIGQENYITSSRYNGQPAAGIGIQLASGANALQTAKRVSDFLERMKPNFPNGVKIVSPYDTVPFVRISIQEVVKTLLEAIALVFAVMYLFLQNFRATIIPTIAVPVVLLGTFGVMAAFGFSINTLTMFGLVLAIGLLVDDAIVVVENVERVMREEHLPPKEATIRSMEQITGALIGIAVVLSAVFVPMAFFGGATGAIYRQFSITIVSTMALSVLVAIVLTPTLCATMLHHVQEELSQNGFFGWFNKAFERTQKKYQGIVGSLLRRSGRIMLIYLLLGAGMFWLGQKMPTSFLPEEDQGVMSVQIRLPAGSTEEETLKIVEKVERYFLEQETDTVQGLMVNIGNGGGGNRGQSTAQANIRLRDWSERTKSEQHVKAVIRRAQQAFATIRGAELFVSAPPAIRGMGSSSGLALELQDYAGLGHEQLLAARDRFLELANQSPLLWNVRANALEDTPQLQINMDDRKARAFGLNLEDVNADLSTAWGGNYVNDFVDRNRVKRVYVQADAPFRMKPEDFNRWYFRNAEGEMVPFAAFGTAEWTFGPMQLERYNGFSSIFIQGSAAPNVSSGTAMAEMERIARQLPDGIGYEWTGMSFQERLTGSQAPYLYMLSILVVFLSLAALYESWTIPFAVVLVVPFGILGALVASGIRGLSNDVFFQVGLLAIIGLSAKNAILIVEFAKDLHERGQSLTEATIAAARLRLRPILMTSLAFLLGVLPLAISTGAGSGGQNAIGTGVMGGTFSATALGIFFIPIFFVVVTRLFSHSDKSNS